MSCDKRSTSSLYFFFLIEHLVNCAVRINILKYLINIYGHSQDIKRFSKHLQFDFDNIINYFPHMITKKISSKQE